LRGPVASTRRSWASSVAGRRSGRRRGSNGSASTAAARRSTARPPQWRPPARLTSGWSRQGGSATTDAPTLRLLRQACDRAWAAAARHGAPGSAAIALADRIPEGLAHQYQLSRAFAGVPATEGALNAARLAALAATTLASFAPPAALPAMLTPGSVAAAAIGQLEGAWAARCAAGGERMPGLPGLWAACQLEVLAALHGEHARSRPPPGALARAAWPPAALALLQLSDPRPSLPELPDAVLFILWAAFCEQLAADGGGGGGGGSCEAFRAAWGDGELDVAGRRLAAALLERAAAPGSTPAEASRRSHGVWDGCRAAATACDLLPLLSLRLARAAGLPSALAACVSNGTVGADCIELILCLLQRLLLAAVDAVQNPEPGAPAPETLVACRDALFVKALLRLAAAPATSGAAAAGGGAADRGRAHPGAAANNETPSPVIGEAAMSVLGLLTPCEALAGLPSSVAAAAPASTAALAAVLRRFATAGEAPPGVQPPQRAQRAYLPRAWWRSPSLATRRTAPHGPPA
jgi:hypothetical protein